MARGPELEIDGDLFRALVDVLGAMPAAPEPVVVVSVYVHSLAKGYGLSERVDEDPLVRAAVAEPAVAQVAYYLPESGSTNADALRDRLYSVFVEISRDTRALKTLNKSGRLGDVEMLKAAQIYWNLEADERTPLLPIRPGHKITANGTTVPAGIRVPNGNKDFATMKWTARINQRDAHQSSGQGFRNLGARLAVLAAKLIVAGAPETPPSLGEAAIVLNRTKKKASIVWPDTERISAAPAAALAEHVRAIADLPASVASEPSAGTDTSRSGLRQVLVGTPADVGSTYQRRGFDAEIDRLWAEGGDRRVWLRGGPGLGKSYTARRVMQEALAHQGDDLEDLLIWVDSADPPAVRQAFSSAVDRMPQLGVSGASQVSDRVDRQARALLEVLARSTWRWLIVLDNADAGGLIEAGLIPTGGNPNGRVLITTLSRDHRIAGNGRVIAAELFTPPEAEAFLQAQRDPTNGRRAALARSSPADKTDLASAVGYHPLALSIAAATIVANNMSVEDWITEFRGAEAMDAAADARDAGGYPHLIGATWKLALEKASLGLPDGVVERAAMVAGVQDPDGHPTWLWDRDDVIGWVADGSELARRYGVPVVVQRLIDHGIIEMRSDTWKHGKVAIHQLAARAVRELADAATLAALAAILVNEWLLHLTEDEAATRPVLRRNIEPLAALPGLSTSTDQATTALLYSERQRTREYAWERKTKGGVAAYLEKGGTTGQAVLAHQLATLGDSAENIGLVDEARARYTQAAELYEQVVESPSVADAERADPLHVLGKLYGKLGHPDRAREAFTQALRLYEQISAFDSDLVNFPYLIRMAQLHRALGNRDALVAVIGRAEMAIDAVTDLELVEAMRDLVSQTMWSAIAEQLRLLGRLDQATRLLALVVEASQQSGMETRDVFALRKLARIYAEAGQWGEAADVLARVTTGEDDKPDDLVLLASIQMHLGRLDDAKKNITRAAKIYREHEPGRPKRGDDDPDGAARAAIVIRVHLTVAASQALSLDRWDDAAGLYEGLVDLNGREADRDPGEHEHELATSNLMLGIAKFQSDQPGEAVDPLTRAANIYQMLTDLNPNDQEAQISLVLALTSLAGAHAKLRQPDEAVDYLTRAMDIVSAIPDPDSEDRSAQEAFALHLDVLGYVSTELGKLDQAAYSYLRLVGIRLMTAKLAPGSAIALRNLARAKYKLGSVNQQLGQLDSAESWLTFAVDNRQELADLDPDDRDAQGELAQALAVLGTVHFRLERVHEAEHTLTRAVEIRRTLADLDPDDRDAQKYLASSLAILGAVYRAVGRLEDAVDCHTRATNVFLLLVDLAPGAPDPEVVKATISACAAVAMPRRRAGPQRSSPSFTAHPITTRTSSSTMPMHVHNSSTDAGRITAGRPASACPLSSGPSVLNNATRSTNTHPLPATRFASDRPACKPRTRASSTASTIPTGISQVSG